VSETPSRPVEASEESLTDADRARYQWQIWTPGFGETGQRKLKSSTVLISRVGGVGGAVAWALAAAGVGRLILAHAGNLRLSDLNRQTLMTSAGLDQPRVHQAAQSLRELNPSIDITPIAENMSESNARGLVESADVVVDAAPLFAERFAMNRACVLLGRPLVECAMHDFEATLTTVLPGVSPCLRCRHPVDPPHWTREFPVFAAIASTIGSLAAVEVLKLLTGLGDPLAGTLLSVNLKSMQFRRLPLLRDPECAVCGG
jgi:molybdopterin/thiamine biosynthesis adenylyltransferase